MAASLILLRANIHSDIFQEDIFLLGKYCTGLEVEKGWDRAWRIDKQT